MIDYEVGDYIIGRRIEYAPGSSIQRAIAGEIFRCHKLSPNKATVGIERIEFDKHYADIYFELPDEVIALGMNADRFGFYSKTRPPKLIHIRLSVLETKILHELTLQLKDNSATSKVIPELIKKLEQKLC